MSYTPSPLFHSAASYLSSVSSPPAISTSTKLELYGLFKRLTTSPVPLTSRPSLFDMTTRAKWDAWAQAGKTWGEGKEGEAERRYLEIASTLGWADAVGGENTQAVENSCADEQEGDVWDDELEVSSSSHHTGGGGMGNFVSTISASPVQPDDLNTLHGLAVSNRTSQLSTYLRDYPDADVNAFDEFGYTPLHLASDRGHLEVVRILLSKGADRSLKDVDDFTALELAHIAGHDEVEKSLKN